MIHSDNGRVTIQGTTETMVDDLTFAVAAVLQGAKCKERKALMNIGLNIVNNAVEIILDRESEKANGNLADSYSRDNGC